MFARLFSTRKRIVIAKSVLSMKTCITFEGFEKLLASVALFIRKSWLIPYIS
jgi:hypothetical protein